MPTPPEQSGQTVGGQFFTDLRSHEFGAAQLGFRGFLMNDFHDLFAHLSRSLVAFQRKSDLSVAGCTEVHDLDFTAVAFSKSTRNSCTGTASG